TGTDVVLQETERARLAAELDEPCVVAGLGHQIDGAAQGVPAVREGVGSLVDLDALGRQELERLEVAEAVGLTVDEAVDEHVDAAPGEVVAQSPTPDRDLA